MSAPREPVELPAVDTPPKSGAWVDPEEWEPTAQEVADGNRLGADLTPRRVTGGA